MRLREDNGGPIDTCPHRYKDNGVPIDMIMENFDAYSQPVYGSGPIELQRHSGPLWFRNIRIRELPISSP